MNLYRLALSLLFVSTAIYADTPPPGTVKAKLNDGAGTPITSTLVSGKQGIDVNIIAGGGGGSSTVDQGIPNGGGANAWFVQGSLGRTWSLLNTTDSVNVGNFPANFGRTWTLLNTTDSVNAVQSGAWSTGRTWTLNSGTDSVTIAGSITASNPSVGPTGSPIPVQSTLVGGSDGTNLRALKVSNAGVLSVDGSGVIQPVSGSVSVSNLLAVQPVSQSGAWTVTTTPSGTQSTNLSQLAGASFSATNYLPSRITNGTTYVDPTQIRALSSGTDSVAITAGSLPLPSGAATSVLQTTGNSSLSSIDSKIPSGLTVTATRLLVDGSGVTQPVSVSSLPLPSGAATSANQTTANTSLASIDGKTPALGQALAAGSVPVVLTASQLTTLTPLSTVAVTQSTSPWVVSGAVTANAGTNLNTSALALESGGHLASIDTKLTSPLSVAQSGSWNIGNITGTVSLPTGASTSALQTSGNSSLTSILANQTNGTQTTQISQATPGTTNNVTLSGVGNSFNGQIGVGVFPTGSMKAGHDPTQLFDDTFATSGSLDTTNRWATPIAAGGGVVATVPIGGGDVALGTGTTAGGYSTLASQPSFPQLAPGWIEIYHAINLSAASPTNAFLFWGLGTIPVTPTIALPLTDAIGFEVATNGKMFAITYSGGVRNIIQDLSTSGNSLQPTDTAVHKYYVFFRGDHAFWSIDTMNNVVATMPTGAPGPINNTLPLRLLAIANSTPPGSSVTMSDNAVFVGDTTGGASQISDGTYNWRKATVDSSGNLAVKSQIADATGAVTGPLTTISGTNYFPVVQSSSASPGSAVPSRATYIAGTDGTNARGLSVDTNGVVQTSLGNTSGKVTKMLTGSLITTATTANQVALTYTVTAAKTFYLEYFDMAVVLTGAGATQTSFGTMSLSINGVVVYTQNLKGAGSYYNAPVHFSEPIPVAAGQVVLIEVTPGAVTSYTWNANFGGYEK